MGTSQSSCKNPLPPNQYTFFNWHNSVCNLYAFYDVAGDKKIIKYVRIANEDKCYNCVACLQEHRPVEFEQLRLHAAGIATLYGVQG
ncbi:hypothetical protein SPRG_03750 [Saprolegnia parasitica CBS 223.65]|uniref:Uncharacterized protein n=1 Tax=Saprolegnia parasitica (strain CBS 223.65) TaxID=695850 RepID=A0A067CRG1_SAPPC|nr:hypothetical protein SPRG_03750 [Saprolegnia parasitica CBS 223.65]KDO31830.1 hypothetical protein SPRG_03750 [Saprolegnia parasitica CBS 223.65]|eukprot:XP_012197709.1 hypothetical protein SPRG_03750 [Saprolegnia parasitica CBS 223.65]